MAQKAPLVCQHLENVSRKVLEEYQDIIRQYVRHRHGVYALYRRKKLYYVGLASNLRSRLSRHLKDRHAQSWDRFSVYLTIGDSHLRELESLLLRITLPSGNKQKGKFAKSEDLCRRFAHDAEQSWRLEMQNLLGLAANRPLARQPLPGKNGRVPVLAAYTHAPFKLRAHFKGQRIGARVRRDGSVRFNGRIFTSPSLAAAAACKKRTCNGWVFWQFERAPGDWVSLDELRK